MWGLGLQPLLSSVSADETSPHSACLGRAQDSGKQSAHHDSGPDHLLYEELGNRGKQTPVDHLTSLGGASSGGLGVPVSFSWPSD